MKPKLARIDASTLGPLLGSLYAYVPAVRGHK